MFPGILCSSSPGRRRLLVSLFICVLYVLKMRKAYTIRWPHAKVVESTKEFIE
jgi:hypothetical protein